MKIAIFVLCCVASAVGERQFPGRFREISAEKVHNFDDIRMALVRHFNLKSRENKFFALYEMEKMERQVKF